MMTAFRVYSREAPVCPYCVKAKDLLGSLGLPYAVFDVSEPENKAYILGLGYKKVPQIWHGSEHIGGFDKLQAFLSPDKIKEITS